MRAFALHRSEPHGELAGAVLCHDIRGAFRKGHVLRKEDIPRLIGAEWSELHLLELGPNDVGQQQANEMLAHMFATPDLEVAAAGHRRVLKAKHSGLVRIDTAALQRINKVPGIALFTLPDDSVVPAGEIVAEAQITPLAIDRRALAKVANEKHVIRNVPFPKREVVIFARDERLVRNLIPKIEWFGCEVSVQRQPGDLSAEETARSTRIYIVTGSNALDPLDPSFVALEEIGAKIQRVGLPLHPGTLLWIASLGLSTIIGVPSCAVGQQTTGFDLLFPKILALGAISDDELAALGHGGILNAHASARTRSYEPVR